MEINLPKKIVLNILNYKSDILAYRRQDYQIDVLVNNKEAAERKYAGIVIDHATIDEIMLILVKGEQK